MKSAPSSARGPSNRGAILMVLLIAATGIACGALITLLICAPRLL